MTQPGARERDPEPLARSGEAALVAAAGIALVLAVAALAGVALAAVLAGAGWRWPADGPQAVAVLHALLTGHGAAGLPPPASSVPASASTPASASGSASGSASAWSSAPSPTPPPLVYASVALCELLAVALTAAGGVALWRSRRPLDARRGMATRDQAQQVLGRRRLHAVAPVLRPDLCRPGRRTAGGPSRSHPAGTAGPGAPQPPAQDLR